MDQNESSIKSNKFMLGIVTGILVAISLGYVSSILINSGFFVQIFGSLPVFIYRSILLSLTGIVTVSLAGFIFGRMIREDAITNKKIKITGISLGLLSLLSIKGDIFLSFIEFILYGNLFGAFIVMLPIVFAMYAGYKGAAYGYRKEATDITGVPRADQYKEIKRTGSSAERIGVFSVLSAEMLRYLAIILVLVGIALSLYGHNTRWDIINTGRIILFAIFPLLVIIGFVLIFSSAKLNPFKGVWKKIAVLLSLIPFAGLILAIYYSLKHEDEDHFTGIVCLIIFVFSTALLILAMIKGWIGYCAGNEICIKWDKIFI
ncbi:MAG: hypothetical protein O8C64_14735 [Candidatus Methanoperedens sp.]|nr:hypothetical protein [Candidatus Methanoperedens sp.]MCZ7406041.1 hypothetical protein [Candidatus Methanoperedens sp.]